MIGYQITEFAANYIEALAGILINTAILGDENQKPKHFLAASLAIAAITWLINQHQIFSAAATIWTILGICVYVCGICRFRLSDSLVLTLFYLITIYIIDFLMASIIGLILGDSQFVITLIQDLSLTRSVFLTASKLLLLGICGILIKGFTRIKYLPMRKLWISVIICAVIVAYFVQHTLSQISYALLGSWSLSLFLILLGSYSIKQYLAYLQEKNDLRMLTKYNELLTENYKRQIQNYQNSLIFYHDIKNQYVILENYLKNKEYEKAESYIENLGIMKQKATSPQWTGNQTLDILIECKKEEAEAEKIQVEITAAPARLKLTDQEITALIGNIFDNAIEACRKTEQDKRWIKMAICSSGEMTFIKVSNSYSGLPDQKLSSAKPNPNAHGFGIASIKMIVGKYNGDFNINYHADECSVVVSFFSS